KNGSILLRKCAGKVADLENIVEKNPIEGTIGIAHTRWATHGKPSTENSHPHMDCKEEIAVIHNGIIENYIELRHKLADEGHNFRSVTDTEVLSHLIEKHMNGSLEEAVRKALREVEGSFAIAVLHKTEPNKIVVAKKGSPLIIGIGDDETFIASDTPAIIKYTGKVIYLNDLEIASVKKKSVEIMDLDGKKIKKKVNLVSWDPVSAEKGGYNHFMLKEIHEQPIVIRNTISSRIKNDEIRFDELKITDDQLKEVNRVIFTACGTSWHAGLIGEYLIEKLARIPSEVEYAAEFRYRNPVIDKNTLIVAISQSGETADTLGAIQEAKSKGAKILSIVNVRGSSIARESDGVIYTHAGPEIGVASTKAFTTQIAEIYLLALKLGTLKGSLTEEELDKRISDLIKIPQKLEKILQEEKHIEDISNIYYKSTNALYLGRGEGFPVALEGALKLKEVSYIHAEGYPAAEMKHGPIALIDENMPVIALAFKGRRLDKIMGNIEEVKARGGIVIAIATEGDQSVAGKADDIIYIPGTPESLSAILAVVPLQLLAYHIAVKRGCHVDQPRNLAKSVTVE
ncbi:glutamine--fructose-6-phosphate transaminase (isomerizing), partial [Candidatus Margulisiibacteriota bacterium]